MRKKYTVTVELAARVLTEETDTATVRISEHGVLQLDTDRGSVAYADGVWDSILVLDNEADETPAEPEKADDNASSLNLPQDVTASAWPRKSPRYWPPRRG